MLYLEDYLEMIEHLPQELRDRFTEMRELDLAVQNNMDSLDKKSRFFFQQCKRGELHNESINTEFYSLRSEYFKVMEDSDEKVAIATQIHELVERYLRRLDNELFKFKCELEADNNGITEILEKRSLELDGNNSTAATSLLQNISQKENRYYNTNLIHNFIGGGFNSDAGIITNIGNNCATLLVSGSTLNNLSATNCSVSGGNQRNRKLEKRRETICTVPVQEKRTNLNQSLAVADNVISGGGTIINVVMGNHVNSAAHVTLPVASGSAKNNAPAALGGNVIRQLSTNLAAHTGLSTNTNNATAANVSLGAIAGKSTTIPGNHGGTIVSYSLQQLGRGAAGSSAIAAAASQAIVTTQQMPQGRRTASLKASYEAIHGATVNTSTEFWSAAVAHNNSMQPVTATLANSITHHQQQPLHNQHYQEKKKNYWDVNVRRNCTTGKRFHIWKFNNIITITIKC